jgi:hypothetical protein
MPVDRIQVSVNRNYSARRTPSKGAGFAPELPQIAENGYHPSMQIPHWQLPPGVSHGTWEYTQRDSIADDYDDYFAFNSLFEFDQPLLLEEFQDSLQTSAAGRRGLWCRWSRPGIAGWRSTYRTPC